MRFENVEVRKKGFFGSLSSARPSLKLRFTEDLGPYGLERMTLNNDNQDPSHLRTCLTYRVMDAAGVPAPRCNHARVSVNGEDLGVFTHVDSMNKPFLRLYFEDPDGALFEGQLGDFTAPYLGGYGETRGHLDREFLADLQEALERPDQGDMLRGVSARVDVDAFLSFWAAEALVGQWDGYGEQPQQLVCLPRPHQQQALLHAVGPRRGVRAAASEPGPRVHRRAASLGVHHRAGWAPASSRCPASGGATKLACSTCWTPPGTKMRCWPRWRASRRCWAPTWPPSRRPRCRTTSAARVWTSRPSSKVGLPAQLARPVDAPICLFAVANVSGTFDTTFDTLDLTAITEERAAVT